MHIDEEPGRQGRSDPYGESGRGPREQGGRAKRAMTGLLRTEHEEPGERERKQANSAQGTGGGDEEEHS